jgi:uncharacterized protein YciI
MQQTRIKPHHLFCSILVFVVTLAHAQEPVFDQELANSFGADEYGMKSYSFVILKKGSVVIEDEQEKQNLMRGHLDNITRLADEGKLIVAGPFGKNGLNYRGLFVLTTPSTEEALALLKTDPAIAAGVFDIDVLPWYGAAALGAYLDTQKKITKTNP